MATKTIYVKQCSCCDTRFSKFSFPAIDAEYKGELEKLMRKVIKRLKLKGVFELIGTNELVDGFYYEYANKSEELFSGDLCNCLYDIACDFYEMHLEQCNLVQAF